MAASASVAMPRCEGITCNTASVETNQRRGRECSATLSRRPRLWNNGSCATTCRTISSSARTSTNLHMYLRVEHYSCKMLRLILVLRAVTLKRLWLNFGATSPVSRHPTTLPVAPVKWRCARYVRFLETGSPRQPVVVLLTGCGLTCISPIAGRSAPHLKLDIECHRLDYLVQLFLGGGLIGLQFLDLLLELIEPALLIAKLPGVAQK